MSRTNIAGIVLCMLVGGVLRVVPYAHNRSLWGDEAMLALNITHRDYVALTRPLDYGQAAPLGFLALERAALDALGGDERSLRLIPLASALLGLALFAGLAWRMASPGGCVIALTLFALSPPLGYYASELKQYSSDVLACVAILLLADRYWRTPTGRAATALAVAGTLAVWLSYTAVFVCAGVGVTLLATAFHRGPRRSILPLAGVGALWVLSFTLVFLWALRDADPGGYLASFWQRGFMPFPPRTADELSWLPRSFLSVFVDPLGLPFAGIGATTFVTGCAWMWRAHPVRLGLLLGPVAFVLLAAALHLYPFATSGDASEYPLLGRVILFVAPPLLLLCGAGIAALTASPPPAVRVAGGTMLLLLVTPLAWEIPGRLMQPMSLQEVRPLVEKIARRGQAGDVVLVNEKAHPILHYYIDLLRAPGSVLDAVQVVVIEGKGDRPHIRRVIEALRAGSRVFLLYAHHPAWRSRSDEDFAAAVLSERGEQIFESRKPGAALHLYRLEPADARRTEALAVAPRP